MSSFSHRAFAAGSAISAVVLAALLISGCAGSSAAVADSEPEPEVPANPLVGDWSWAVDTPQGLFTGGIVFTTEGDSLIATMSVDSAPDDSLTFGANFDLETNTVSFSFDSGEFGWMDVEMTLEDGMLAGEQFARDYSMGLDITATRKEEAPSQ